MTGLFVCYHISRYSRAMSKVKDFVNLSILYAFVVIILIRLATIATLSFLSPVLYLLTVSHMTQLTSCFLSVTNHVCCALN